MKSFRQREIEAFAQAGNVYDIKKHFKDEIGEIGVRENYRADPNLDKLKFLSDKTIEGLNKYFPLPKTDVIYPKEGKKNKPKAWSIKSQLPAKEEAGVLEESALIEPEVELPLGPNM